MVNKSADKKTTGLSIALGKKDRATIDKAARLLGLPPSVWGRAQLLKEAMKIVSEAASAK
jgi:hypothetical protein